MRTVWNVLLALGSLVVGLSLCEAALRVLHPRYDYAARPPQRIHHWSSEYPHPDTGAKHRVAYNNLGSRQHRDFNERDLAEGVNLAFFGDSYTENLRMPAHHSFTEVLDYLLSDSTAEGSFKRGARGAHLPRAPNFNVLNFGITGTGPVEQYSRWASLAVKPRLRHVFYVHMTNDIANVRYAMRHAGRRSGGEAARVSAGIRALSRLHLTYLALDVWRRLDDGAAQRLSPMSESEALAAFESVLRRWRREVEAAGGEFHIVLLPTPDGDRWFRRLESPSSWNVLDLPGCFNEAIPNYDYADWRFAKDTHWNEAANMVAARCLYRDLEDLLDLPERSDAQLAQALQGYYAAFQDPDRFGGEAGWMPPPSPVGMAVPLADSEADRIVARYQALDQDGDTYRRRVVDAVRSSEPVLRSVWNVHLSAEHRLVVYVRSPQPGEREGRAPRKKEPSAGEREGRAPRKKEPCDAEQDPSRGMFLQVRPFNVAWLRPPDQARGHYAVDLRARSWLPPNGFESAACVLAVPLPRWLAVSARTGQQAADGELLWEGEFPVDDVEEWNRMRAHYRREYRAIAETEPVARSVWDVHALRERREIAFLKAPCALADLLAGYFVLRTFPARNVQGGVYTETSFSFQTHTRRRRFSAHIGPTMFDDSCLLIAPLPDGRVGAVKVGEYAHNRALIWQATFYWDMDSLRRAHAAVSGRRPDAAGAFEVYRREDALVYVREPCAEADTRQRFFLHAYAARAEGGDARRVNLDFDFVHRGALFDGKCVALAPLPEAVPGGGPIVRLRTGQFASAGETWAVELAEA